MFLPPYKPDSAEYESSFDPRLFLWSRHLSCTLAVLCTLIGGLFFYNELFPIPMITTLNKMSLIQVKPFTSLSFIFAGLTLLFYHFRLFRPTAKLLSVAIGLIPLAATVIDLFYDYHQQGFFSFPHQISILAFVSFLLLSISLYFLRTKNPTLFLLSQLLAIAVGTISLFVIYAYTFDFILSFDLEHFATPSLVSCILFELLAVAILFYRPTEGYISIFSNKTLGGYTGRRFVLIPLFAPFIILVLRLLGQELFGLLPSTAYAIGTLINMFLLTVLIIYYARVLWEIDLAQKTALANEIELNKHIEKLTRSKTELEQLKLFAFVTTHDLQEPLHKIQLFGNLIQVDPLVQNSESLKNNVEKVSQSVEILRNLINQLHEYALISFTEISFSTIDLNEILENVLNELGPQIKNSNAKIYKDQLPKIQGNSSLFSKIFLNLIGNAIHFRKEEESPIIKISTKTSEDSISITVEDNGIGIDSRYLNQIFEPFQRFHHSNKYPGKGLGLATCKRIVQRHGGEISVTSTLGVGSTFTFTLSKKQWV